MSKLSELQQKLKVGKRQFNKFGGYKYRSAEDILAGVKPLLDDGHLVISDDLLELNGRVYVKSTVTLSVGDSNWSASCFAREADSRKGMDAPQLTGTAHSYAVKYALQSLFALEPEDDPDQLPPITDTVPDDSLPTTPQKREPDLLPDEKGGAHTPPSSPQVPPPSQDERIPAPDNTERKWLTMLWDYYVAQSEGQKLDKQKMLKLAHLHLGHHPASQADVELLKKYIAVRELGI